MLNCNIMLTKWSELHVVLTSATGRWQKVDKDGLMLFSSRVEAAAGGELG